LCIIEKNPTSRAAKEFISFLELLKNENFEETQSVEDFFKRKFDLKFNF